MLVKELIEKLELYCGRDEHKTYDKLGDWRVVVRLSDPSVGGCACVDVDNVFPGFDWDHGKFIIHASEPIIRKKKRSKK